MPLTQLTTSFSDMALGLSSSERTSPTASPAPSSPSKPLKSALRRTASSPALKKPSPVGNTPATANTPRAPRVQFPPFVKAVNMRMFSPDEPAVLVNEVYRHRFMSDLTMPRPASVLATLCERQKIVLEDTSFTYPWLEGTVVVANLAYEKDVVVRMSFNNWLTFLDVPAEYAGKFKRRPDRDMDVFSFKIDLSPYFIDGRTLSVCFHVTYNRSETYWDNNSQRNYVTRMNEGVRMPATSRLNFSVPLPVRSPQSRPRSLADDMLGGSDELAPRRLEYVWTAENDNEDGSGEGGEGEEEEDDDDDSSSTSSTSSGSSGGRPIKAPTPPPLFRLHVAAVPNGSCPSSDEDEDVGIVMLATSPGTTREGKRDSPKLMSASTSTSTSKPMSTLTIGAMPSNPPVALPDTPGNKVTVSVGNTLWTLSPVMSALPAMFSFSGPAAAPAPAPAPAASSSPPSFYISTARAVQDRFEEYVVRLGLKMPAGTPVNAAPGVAGPNTGPDWTIPLPAPSSVTTS